MNNKIIAVIGALLFASAVVVGNFAQFEAAAVIEIALAVVGGVLCCIGGLQQAIFKEIRGLVLALLIVIFSLVFDSKKE